MIELVDTTPTVEVPPAEYMRLLGYPPHGVPGDRARELADWARDWYAAHGRPWVYARQTETLSLRAGSIVMDGVTFTSPRLFKTLRDAGADAALLVAVSAGPELEAEARRRWEDGKPDEYFFLEVYGSAVVEHLVTMTGARLCAWADTQELAVLPHYSPGYPEWAITEQAALLERIARQPGALPGEVDVMTSGMLRPKKSLLAVFGLTRHTNRVHRLSDLVPCENCSFLPCQYRRAPYRRAPMSTDPELSAVTGQPPPSEAPPAGALDSSAAYATSAKALARWAHERLTLAPQGDGSIAARFRFEGTTCSNMGQPLSFDYHLLLGPRHEGFIIREQRCEPAPGDDGYTRMCRYISNGAELMSAIDQEKPLAGHPLNDVLTWARPHRSAGCYCEPDSRQHKWGLVLETLHFALSRARQA